MTIVDSLKNSWQEHGLLHNATFIEDIGTACAENVRSAALSRWINQKGSDAVSWLNSVTHSNRYNTVQSSREVTLDNAGRIDLRVDQDGEPAAFIEVKWASEPSLAQLIRYRDAIDVIAHDANILLVSPIQYVASQYADLPKNVYPVEWSTISDVMGVPQGRDATIESDLNLTLIRWCKLRKTICEAVQDSSKTVDELTNLVKWLDETSVDKRPNAPSDYAKLTRLAIVTELADRFVQSIGMKQWRRCGASSGPHADVQADVCRTDVGYYPCDDFPEVGMAVVLRFHAYNDLERIDVVLGSTIVPYLEGTSRTRWIEADERRWEMVQQKAAMIRNALHENLRNAGHRHRGNPNTRDWWSRSAIRRFSGRDRIIEVIECAKNISSVFNDLPKG